MTPQPESSGEPENHPATSGISDTPPTPTEEQSSSIGYVADTETGEIVSVRKGKNQTVFQMSPEPERRYEPYCMVDLAPIEAVADNPNLSNADMRVFLKIIGRMGYNNHIVLNAAKLGEELNCTRESVSRSLSRLTKAGILFRGSKEGRSYNYSLNAWIGWRGNAKDRKRVASEQQRQRERERKDESR